MLYVGRMFHSHIYNALACVLDDSQYIGGCAAIGAARLSKRRSLIMELDANWTSATASVTSKNSSPDININLNLYIYQSFFPFLLYQSLFYFCFFPHRPQPCLPRKLLTARGLRRGPKPSPFSQSSSRCSLCFSTFWIRISIGSTSSRQNN